MNLFASFILRALSILIKDALLEANHTSQDLSGDQEQGFSRASMPPVEMLANNEVSIDLMLNSTEQSWIVTIKKSITDS